MAVLGEWRRRGVGTALLEALLERARKRSIRRITLHAQTHAAAFYRRFGFNERGEEFLEGEIPHVEMTLELFPAREGSDSRPCRSRRPPRCSFANGTRSVRLRLSKKQSST